jgi:Ni/Co efflux regulator RcnB
MNMKKKSPLQTAIVAGLAAALSLGGAGAAFAQRHDDERHDNDHPAAHHEEMRRGAGPDHAFYVGHRMPAEYRGHNYVVDDWRGHHLRQPPRGYQWVQSGSDYVLVAIASGIIASAILNN